MSFIASKENIRYMPGFFLASEECSRETVTVLPSHSQVVTMADGSKYVPAGAVIPSNDGNAKGILYEDVDVSTGAMPGSIVTRGVVYEDKLPAAIESTAEAVEQTETPAEASEEKPGTPAPDSQTFYQVYDINLENVDADNYESGFQVEMKLSEEVQGNDIHLYHVHATLLPFVQ